MALLEKVMRTSLLVFLGTLLGCSNSQQISWDSITRKIQTDFPDVQEITVEELSRMLAEGEALRLFDVREAKEYAVSHISSAENLESAGRIAAAVSEKSARIVAYCSVGYRSGKVAEELRSLGYSHIYNLKGSIFEWANEGRPVFSGGEEIQFVHPFNETWGVLLNERLHRYDASE